MQILLSCAKTMSLSSKVQPPYTTEPRFLRQASDIAFQMTRFSVEELEQVLHVKPALALENFHRYQAFHGADTPAQAALLAYTGIVFKKLAPSDFTAGDFEYAQQHLRLTSFCYGLLRPLDKIRLYRLEGGVRLPDLEGATLFDFWSGILTGTLLDDIRQAGGVLCNLASDEMRSLFQWNQVEDSCRVVTPEFKVFKKGKPVTVVVYTKMCRGEMARFLLKNRIESPDRLRDFEWEGFCYNEALSDENHPVFTLG